MNMVLDAVILHKPNFDLRQQLKFHISILFQFEIFYVFIFKVLNVVSADQNKNIDLFYTKNPKICKKLHLFKKVFESFRD